eukprot:1084958-Amorphochlora_amoeboformis.AAC.2
MTNWIPPPFQEGWESLGEQAAGQHRDNRSSRRSLAASQGGVGDQDDDGTRLGRRIRECWMQKRTKAMVQGHHQQRPQPQYQRLRLWMGEK